VNADRVTGARLAAWWVSTITRTAEGSVARDRRAEVASDVHDQLADAGRRGALGAGSRAVVGRVVRGMPSDLAWRVGLELRPGRFAWHLRNPSTAITTTFVAMVPLNAAADSAGTRARQLVDYRVPLWVATDILGVCILLLAMLALASRAWPGWTAGVESFQPGSRLERARRCATATLGIAMAGSAVFRFGALSLVGGVFWAAFAAALVTYLALLVVTGGVRLLTLGRYLPKVSA